MRIPILELIDSPMLGGGQQHVLGLARSLDPERFDVTVCSSPDGPLVAQLEAAGIRHVACEIPKRPDPRVAYRLRAVIRRGGYQIVHTHGGVAGLWARVASLGLEAVDRVHTIHGIHYLNYDSRWARVAMTLMESALSKATARIICVCRSDLAKALRAGVVSVAQARVVSNGIDLGPYRTLAPAESVRTSLGLAGPGPLLGTIGRLHRQKGQAVLLQAFQAVAQALPEARLALVGEGGERERLTAQARELGIESLVKFLGARTDVPRLLAAFDLFVLPSLWEGLPLTLMEAMAAGRPLVASRVDGVEELVTDGVEGALVEAGDPAALAAALLELCRDSGRRAMLGERARERAMREFGVEAMGRAVAAIYEELAERR